MNSERGDYQYYAFISYNRNDVNEARELHEFIEDFTIPRKFRSDFHKGKSFGKVFFAPENYAYADDLTEELKERLRNSRYLIVVCSPASARSYYVGLEIDYFCSLERKSNVLFYIVRGLPVENDDECCYSDAIWKNGLGSKLAADITTKNYSSNWFKRTFLGTIDDKRAAQLNIIASLLGVKDRTEFISSHQRRTSRRNVFLIVLIVVFFTAILGWYFNKAVDVSVDVESSQISCDSLPPLRNGMITLYLDNDVIRKNIDKGVTSVSFPNVPKKMLGNKVRVIFSGDGFYTQDMSLMLERNILLPVQRDSLLYGRVRFLLRDPDMSKVAGCRVEVEGVEAISDENGFVDLYVPLRNQKSEYLIKCEIPLKHNRIIPPCTGSEVIFLQSSYKQLE